MSRSGSSKKPSQVTPEQASAILKQAEQQKIEICSMELEKILSKHGCIMQPQVVIRGSQIIPQVIILLNPTPAQESTLKMQVPETEEEEE
jgi:hypothetical protein